MALIFVLKLIYVNMGKTSDKSFNRRYKAIIKSQSSYFERLMNEQKSEIDELRELQELLRSSHQEIDLVHNRILTRVSSKVLPSSGAFDVFSLSRLVSDAIDAALDGFFITESGFKAWSLAESIAENGNDESKRALLIHLRKQLSIAQGILKGLHHVLASLEAEKLPTPVPHPVNFIKNNKLPASDDEEFKHVRMRHPVSIAEDLANVLHLTDKEMAVILTISIRTYHRLKLNGLLNPVASERLILLKELAEYGLEVFENQHNFNEWLRLPLQELGNVSPLNSLDTATGFNLVKTVLGRIEYGIYS